ncbi:MAG TPA: ribosomal protein S18-alanine N-acetyltransferase [Ilumatobacteraceae bacterium]|nr:ribosomal protein S18-alanine N-acetyltransferase [Ilumatobacteraceae bacterium]
MLSRLLNRPSGPRGLVIEPMRRRDLTAIQVIERQVYPQPWSVNVFANEIEMSRQGQRYYICAHRDSMLVGYAGMMVVLDEAHITNVAVDPQRQRQGIGQRLLAELAWEARRRGCNALTLEVRLSNVAAQAMYQRFGFEPAGIRAKYYENVEDAIVMWCNGIDTPDYARRLRQIVPGCDGDPGQGS